MLCQKLLYLNVIFWYNTHTVKYMSILGPKYRKYINVYVTLITTFNMMYDKGGPYGKVVAKRSSYQHQNILYRENIFKCSYLGIIKNRVKRFWHYTLDIMVSYIYLY